MLRVKIIRPEVKVLDAKKGRLEVIVSDETKDRDGDIIRAAFWDMEDFQKHPVLVASHDYMRIRSQIGEWEDMSIKGTKLKGIPRYYVGEGNDEADWAFNLASKGRAAFSVGFLPDMNKAKPLNEKDPFSGMEFLGQKLLEVSHVVVPSNPNAVQQMIKSANLDPTIKELLDEMLGDTTLEPTPNADMDVLAKRFYALIQGDIKALIQELREVVIEKLSVPNKNTYPDFRNIMETAFQELKEEQV